MKVRVRSAHSPPDRPPIRIEPGDEVTVIRRDHEWPAFTLVTTAAGGTGWVPARYLTKTEGRAHALQAYDTTELQVNPGDLLDVIERDDEGGWLRCRDGSGRTGWVPLRALETSSQ